MSRETTIIGPVRLSYVSVFKPKKMSEDAPEKYSCVLLIPKKDEALVASVRKAVAAAIPADAPKVNGKLSAKYKICLKDGDALDADGQPYPDEYKGTLFINASSSRQPGVVKRVKAGDGAQFVQCVEEEIYSGCWAYAAVNFYPYNKGTNQGVACGLNNLMKYKDDTRLGADNSAQAAFSGLDVFTQEAAPSIDTADDLPF